MHLHTNALERAIDEISRKLPGFFVGRYDVCYQNEEDFEQGRDFQIVELHGATSEATSIYDPQHALPRLIAHCFNNGDCSSRLVLQTERKATRLLPYNCCSGIGGNIQPLRYRTRWLIDVHRFVSSQSAWVLSRDESRRKTGSIRCSGANDCRS
jgi:hypothetical protein